MCQQFYKIYIVARINYNTLLMNFIFFLWNCFFNFNYLKINNNIRIKIYYI